MAPFMDGTACTWPTHWYEPYSNHTRTIYVRRYHDGWTNVTYSSVTEDPSAKLKRLQREKMAEQSRLQIKHILPLMGRSQVTARELVGAHRARDSC